LWRKTSQNIPKHPGFGRQGPGWAVMASCTSAGRSQEITYAAAGISRKNFMNLLYIYICNILIIRIIIIMIIIIIICMIYNMYNNNICDI